MLASAQLAAPARAASLHFDLGEQAPGQAIEERFTTTGAFTVLCGIHPKMRLAVMVR